VGGGGGEYSAIGVICRTSVGGVGLGRLLPLPMAAGQIRLLVSGWNRPGRERYSTRLRAGGGGLERTYPLLVFGFGHGATSWRGGGDGPAGRGPLVGARARRWGAGKPPPEVAVGWDVGHHVTPDWGAACWRQKRGTQVVCFFRGTGPPPPRGGGGGGGGGGGAWPCENGWRDFPRGKVIGEPKGAKSGRDRGGGGGHGGTNMGGGRGTKRSTPGGGWGVGGGGWGAPPTPSELLGRFSWGVEFFLSAWENAAPPLVWLDFFQKVGGVGGCPDGCAGWVGGWGGVEGRGGGVVGDQ